MDEELDVDQDGAVTDREMQQYEAKAVNRRRMAWLALVAIIASGFAMMFFVSETRLDKLDGLLELYWLSLGGTVGIYTGISSWAAARKR